MTTTAKTPTTPFEFEPALKELESITTWFESSDADLDQGLAKFERGMELASELKEHLAVVENKIEKIKLKFETPGKNSKVQASSQDFDRSFIDEEAKSNNELGPEPSGEDYPHIGLFS